MMQQNNQRRHALLSLGLLLSVIALLFSVLVLPAINGRLEFHNRLSELQFQYAKFQHIVQQSGALQEELAQLQNAQTDQSGFLEEKPEALAAADLQKQIKTLIDTNGGNLISTQVVKSRAGETGVFPEVTIKVHMRSDIEALQKLLYQLASSETVLQVDNLLIQKRRQGGGRRARRDANLLEIRFDTTGYIYQAAISS